MKATKQYFLVVLFIALYKVVVIFGVCGWSFKVRTFAMQGSMGRNGIEIKKKKELTSFKMLTSFARF